jgi:plasmid segregation protein ParM
MNKDATSMQQNIQAIDVGYRMTKYTERLDGETPICRSFPSIAPLASDRDHSVGRGTKRNTVVVPVGKLKYEVGPDAFLVSSTFHVRNFDDAFVKADEYLALCRGALRYMRASHIDLLVVGLPVSLHAYLSGYLENRLKGAHDLGDGKTVHIERVLVMVQPMGALLSYAFGDSQRRSVLKARNVVIDPGGRTFDWVVTQGVKSMPERSHSANKGMVDVLEAIARSVGDQLQCQLTSHDLDNIDKALRTSSKPNFFGKPFDLTPHIAMGEKVVHEAVTAMRKDLQSGSDLDNLILSGGGAFFFKKLIASAYPHHTLLMPDNPLLANVQGFLLGGLEFLASEKRRTARPATTSMVE